MNITPCTENDYPACALIANNEHPESATTAESFRHQDSSRDPKIKFARFVAWQDKKAIAYGTCVQSESSFHPQKFEFRLRFLTEFDTTTRRKQLWDFLMAEVAIYKPISIMVWCRESSPHVVQFLESLGLREVMRYWESKLDVSAFHFAAFEQVIPEVLARGFIIRSFNELTQDPNHKQKFYELWNEIYLDVPQPDEATQVSFERFCTKTFEDPNFSPESCFIALDHTGRWLGMTQLYRANRTKCDTGLTGVRREARRNHLALALKLQAIAFAKNHNITEIVTGNEVNNHSMLAINEMLGFVKLPAVMDYLLELPKHKQEANKNIV